MEGSYLNAKDGGIFQGLTTFRYSSGYTEVPSSAPLVPKSLKSQDLQSRSEFEPSTSADHQISRSFFGPTDYSLRDLYSSQEEVARVDSFSDSGINVHTPNSESSSQKRYPSPLSSRSIDPTTLAVPTRVFHSHSPLRKELPTKQEQIPLIPHRPASFAPSPHNQHTTTKPFKCILTFFSNIDSKYESYIARRQNEKRFKAIVKAKEKEDEEERKKIDEGMREQIELHRERERVRNEVAEREMEKTRREVGRARKMQRKMGRICRRRRLEREKKRVEKGDGEKEGWRSKLQSKFGNLSLSTFPSPWNKNKREQEQLHNERDERQKIFERRWQRAEARRTMRERERGGILGRQVFEPAQSQNQNPFSDMNAARRESRFRETIKEVGSESDESVYDESDEEEIAGQVKGQPFSYYSYRHTVV